MLKISKFLRKQLLFVLIIYLISFVLLVAIEYQVSKLPPLTEGKTVCNDVASTETDGVETVCTAYINYYPRYRYLIPIYIYVLIIICGIIYLALKFKNVIDDLAKFEANTIKIVSTSKRLDASYRFTELDSLATIINQNIEDVNNNEQLRIDYVNHVMHDLKTPLQIIQGYLELLATSTSNQEYVTRAKRQIHYIDTIVQNNTLLNGYQPQIQTTTVLTLIEPIIIDYKQLYPELEINLLVRDQVDWQVDRIGLQRALVNLIENGIGAQITNPIITIELLSNQIRIIDQGTGFSDKQLNWYLTQDQLEVAHYGLKITDAILRANSLQLSYQRIDNQTIATLIQVDK